MYIIQKEPNPSGAYPPIQSWKGTLPDEYVLVSDDLDTTVFYAHNGFVTLTIENDIVTAMEPNIEAWEAWKASLPPAPEPTPNPQEQLRADVDYLAALQGVVL